MAAIGKQTETGDQNLKIASESLETLADGTTGSAPLPDASRAVLANAAKAVEAVARNDADSEHVTPENLKVANAALQAIAEGKDARAVSTDARYAQAQSEAEKKLQGPGPVQPGKTSQLHKAVLANDLEKVMLMLNDRQLDVEARDENGETALALAVLSDNSALVGALLGAGADVAARGPSQETCLHIAAANNRSSVFPLLLEAKADCNAVDADGLSALQLAARKGNTDIVRALLEHGAFRRSLTPGKPSALWLAAVADDPNRDLITLLSERAGSEIYETESGTGLPLLVKLADLNKLEALDLLLENGALINGRDPHTKMTALHYASLHGSEIAVRQLLKYGAYPNARDRRNDTPLHLSKTLSIAMQLVLNGARLDLRNDDNVAAKDLHGGKHDSTEAKVLEDARKGWLQMRSAPVEGDRLVPADWKASNEATCQLCDQSFGIFHPRHTCDRCGTNVCGNCSEMQFYQMLGTTQKNYCCCDGCFLLLTGALKEKIEKEKQKGAIGRFMQAEEEAKIRAKLQAVKLDEAIPGSSPSAATPLGTRSRSSSSASTAVPSTGTPGTQKAHADGESGGDERAALLAGAKSRKEGEGLLDSLKNTLLGNQKLASERGEKLEQLEDKSAALEDNAASFADAARQLRKKMENS